MSGPIGLPVAPARARGTTRAITSREIPRDPPSQKGTVMSRTSPATLNPRTLIGFTGPRSHARHDRAALQIFSAGLLREGSGASAEVSVPQTVHLPRPRVSRSPRKQGRDHSRSAAAKSSTCVLSPARAGEW
jgi:hypothetical protein